MEYPWDSLPDAPGAPPMDAVPPQDAPQAPPDAAGLINTAAPSPTVPPPAVKKFKFSDGVPWEPVVGADKPVGYVGTFVHGVERGLAPLAGGAVAAGQGARIGSALGGAAGALFGPEGIPVGEFLGGVVGGVGGFWEGSDAVAQWQSWMTGFLPTGLLKTFGQDPKTAEAESQQYPLTQTLAYMAPQVLLAWPIAGAAPALREGATGVERFLANPLTQRGIGGVMMGGFEGLNEWRDHKELDPLRIALSTTFGLIFAFPTKAGEYLNNLGALGLETILSGRTPAGVADRNLTATEEVHLGHETKSPERTADDHVARGAELPKPPADIHTEARKDPVVREYDAHVAQRDALTARANDLEASSDRIVPEVSVLRYQAQKADDAAHALAPEVTRAYNRAAQRLDTEIVPPPEVLPEGQNVNREALQPMRGAENAPATVLPEVPRGIHAGVAQEPPPGGRGATQEPGQVGGQRLPEAGGPGQAAVSGVRGGQGGEAPPGLQPPARSDVAVSETPLGTASRINDEHRIIIAADVTRKLVAAGLPLEVARTEAEIAATTYEAVGSTYLGRTALDMYRQEPLDIQRGRERRARAKAAETVLAQLGEPGPKLSIDPKTYREKTSSPAVKVGDEIFVGKDHAEAINRAIQQFGMDSPEIRAFDNQANPLESIGVVKRKEGFVPGISGDDGKAVAAASDARNVARDAEVTLNQSAAPLQKKPLQVTGTGPGERVLLRDLGQVLTDRHMAKYGRELDPNNPADYKIIRQSMSEDYRNQKAEPDNGEAWYTEDIASAIETTRQIIPELAVPQNRDLFLTIAAALSPQRKPLYNWENAILAMQGYLKDGVIALRKPSGKQFGVLSHTTGLQLIQHLINTRKLEGALMWLNSSHTGKEMAEVRRDSGLFVSKEGLNGYLPNEMNLNEKKLGMYMLGPKVGDFAQNATGVDHNAVTVDLWAARTYKRLIGRLLDPTSDTGIAGEPKGKAERELIKRLMRDAAKTAGIEPSSMQAALWYFEQRLYRNHGLQSDSQNFSGAARAAVAKRSIEGGSATGGGETAAGDNGQVLLYQSTLGSAVDQQVTEPFYSALTRAAENLKQEKAPAAQWLATLRNQPGVKTEEIAWLGLEDWLSKQKGTVTKAQLFEFLRANQVQVKEVVKGGKNRQLKPSEVQAAREWAKKNLEGADLEEALDAIDSTLQIETRIVGVGQLEGLGLPNDILEPFRNSIATDNGGMTKFSQYQLPGGENYRELLLTLPPKRGSEIAVGNKLADFYRAMHAKYGERYHEMLSDTEQAHESAILDELESRERRNDAQQFMGGHYEEPNVVAHVRFNDRTDANGKKTLFIEEVQSDWHQKGRKQGYAQTVTNYGTRNKISGNRGPNFSTRQAAQDWVDALPEATGRNVEVVEQTHKAEGVPDAPFKTTWPELALKRMIRWAAENGYDQVAWTPGDVQAERYDLSKHIDSLKWYRDGDGYRISAAKDGNIVLQKTGLSASALADNVGKELAEKIHSNAEQHGVLSGLDLKVGGEGMRGFYDKMMVDVANKLGKKFGAKVTQTAIATEAKTGKTFGHFEEPETEPATQPVHALPITDAMRESVMQGQPMFQGKLGSYRIRPGQQGLLTLMPKANATTFLHELGHHWLQIIFKYANHPDATPVLKADIETLKKWFRIKGDLDSLTPGEFRRVHEQFARGWEQYYREGRAPTARLAAVFAKVKAWFMAIYKTADEMGVPITDSIREVFGRMHGSELPTVIAPERKPTGPSLANIHIADAAETPLAEAEPVLARVQAETARAEQDASPEIKNEIDREQQRLAGGTDTGAETGAGTGAGEKMVGAGSQPEPVASGGALRPRTAPIARGGGGAGAKSAAAPEQPTPVTPNAPFAPKTDHIDKAGNIRLDTLTTDEGVKAAIRESADANDDFIKYRRGKVTDGMVDDLSEAIGFDIHERLTNREIGQAFNAEEVMAARKLLISSATKVYELMQNVAAAAKGEARQQAVLAYAEAKARHQVIQGSVAGITAEAGRALRAFRDISGGDALITNVNEFLKSSTGKTLYQLEMEATLGATMKSSSTVSKFVHDATKRNFGNMLLEYWINGLISGPATHMTYMIGNSILSTWAMTVETTAAAGIGAIRSAAGRQGERVRFGEVPQQLKGFYGQGQISGIKAAIDAMRTGGNVALPGEKMRDLPWQSGTPVEQEVVNALATFHDVVGASFSMLQGIKDAFTVGAEAPLFEVQTSPLGAIPNFSVKGIPLPVGTAARLPGRMVGSIHGYYRAANYVASITGQAYRKAVEEGLTGAAFNARVAELRVNPTDIMLERARIDASENTLMGSSGKITSKVSQFFNAEIFPKIETTENSSIGMKAVAAILNATITQVPWLRFFNPFVHIGSTIINSALAKRTPLGLLSPSLIADLSGKNGNIASDTAAARILAGTALAALFYGLAGEKQVTGSEPVDHHRAATWRLAGYQAHSIRFGDMWYPLHRLGVMGMLASVAADLNDVGHLLSEGNFQEAGGQLIEAFTQTVMDEGWMRGPANALAALEDKQGERERYLRDFFSQFIPYSVGLGQITRMTDPYKRRVKTFGDAVASKVPWESQSLYPQIDTWGEPIPNLPTVGEVTSIYISQLSKDPVNLTMLRLGIAPARVGETIRNVPLTPEQYDYYARVAGKTLKMQLDKEVVSSQFLHMSDYDQHARVLQIIRATRAVAQGMLMTKYAGTPTDIYAQSLKAKGPANFVLDPIEE